MSEGPSDRGKAKEHVRKLLEKPEHRRVKGHPDDLATVDSDVDDPKHQKEKD